MTTTYSELWVTLDGSTTNFTLSGTMTYAAASEIRVYINGEPLTQGTLAIPRDYYVTGTASTGFPAGDQVELTSPGNSGDICLIRRVTSLAQTPVDWSDASILTEADHDRQDQASLRRDQELSDQRGMQRSLVTGQWDAQDLRISSAKDPTLPQDVVTKKYLTDYYGGATSVATGVERFSYTGDGEEDTFRVVTEDSGAVLDRKLVLVFFDGEAIPVAEYTVSPLDNEKIQFVNPPGHGVHIDTILVTASNPSFDDGQISPGKIALATGKLLTGSAGGIAEAIDRDDILLDDLGAPSSTLSMGGQRVSNVATPTAAHHAANKAYVDDIGTVLDPLKNISDVFTTYSWTGGAQNTGTLIHNDSGYTQVIHFVILPTPNVNNNRRFYALIQPTAGGDGRVAAYFDHKGVGQGFAGSMTFCVPANWSWRIVETTGRTITGSGWDVFRWFALSTAP